MKVAEDVLVLGMKGVSVTVEVELAVGVFVMLGVKVMEAVRMGGVPLTVAVGGVPVTVRVVVGVGVTSRGLGAKERQINPAQ